MDNDTTILLRKILHEELSSIVPLKVPRDACLLEMSKNQQSIEKRLNEISAQLANIVEAQRVFVSRCEKFDSDIVVMNEKLRDHHERLKDVEQFNKEVSEREKQFKKHRDEAMWKIVITIIASVILSALTTLWIGFRVAVNQ